MNLFKKTDRITWNQNRSTEAGHPNWDGKLGEGPFSVVTATTFDAKCDCTGVDLCTNDCARVRAWEMAGHLGHQQQLVIATPIGNVTTSGKWYMLAP